MRILDKGSRDIVSLPEKYHIFSVMEVGRNSKAGTVTCSFADEDYTWTTTTPSYAFDAVQRGGVALIRDIVEYVKSHPAASTPDVDI